MSNYSLDVIRHSAAHVLAQAVLHLYPDAKLGIGPAIETGFYYDFDLDHTFSEEDLTRLEVEMNRILKETQTFERSVMSKSEARELMGKRNQPYKVELIDDLGQDEYSFFENGPFLDLCKGPHVTNTKEIGAVKLLRVSGAYWRGSEKNKMLQRIYGTAFHTKQELDDHLALLEEARKRDHRTLGKQLELFSIQDEIGSGLILWQPNGARIRHEMETYWKDEHFKAGYELLYSPHVGRGHLWETSGHLGFYDENMFSPMDVEGQSYYVRPMNCPFHILTYKGRHRSYKELPIRYAELGTVYRYERSGVLHGLMRVRGFTQDDAHIICAESQVESEILSVLDLCTTMLKRFGFEEFKVFLSTRPEEKYVGDISHWELAEKALEKAIQKSGLPYEVDAGGGAFYGPKIDIKIKDAIGRLWQCSTVQFDFNLPERFDMNFINAQGEKERPFMIHRALLGSLERFFGILIEHYAGKFPLWLAPVQIKVLSLNDAVKPYCETVRDALKAAGFRAQIDDSSEKLGYKIRQATTEKVPYMLIVGRNEAAQNEVSIRSRDNGDLGSKSVEDLIRHLQAELNG